MVASYAICNWPEGKQPARNLSRGLTIRINSCVWVDACRQAEADVKVLKAKLRQSFPRFLWRANISDYLSAPVTQVSLTAYYLFSHITFSWFFLTKLSNTPLGPQPKKHSPLYKGPNPDKECTAGVNGLFGQKIELNGDFCCTLSQLV